MGSSGSSNTEKRIQCQDGNLLINLIFKHCWLLLKLKTPQWCIFFTYFKNIGQITCFYKTDPKYRTYISSYIKVKKTEQYQLVSGQLDNNQCLSFTFLRNQFFQDNPRKYRIASQYLEILCKIPAFLWKCYFRNVFQFCLYLPPFWIIFSVKANCELFVQNFDAFWNLRFLLVRSEKMIASWAITTSLCW